MRIRNETKKAEKGNEGERWKAAKYQNVRGDTDENSLSNWKYMK